MPLAFVLTGGQVADCRAGERLLRHLPTDVLVHADKGYDTDRLRRLIETGGSVPNIPPRSHQRWKNCFSPYLYRGRNAIEWMFERLKDFRRVAIRYDRLAKNYLSAVCLAATVSYWLSVSTLGESPFRARTASSDMVPQRSLQGVASRFRRCNAD